VPQENDCIKSVTEEILGDKREKKLVLRFNTDKGCR
jgi:hypothetical protein